MCEHVWIVSVTTAVHVCNVYIVCLSQIKHEIHGEGENAHQRINTVRSPFAHHSSQGFCRLDSLFIPLSHLLSWPFFPISLLCFASLCILYHNFKVAAFGRIIQTSAHRNIAANLLRHTYGRIKHTETWSHLMHLFGIVLWRTIIYYTEKVASSGGGGGNDGIDIDNSNDVECRRRARVNQCILDTRRNTHRNKKRIAVVFMTDT